MREERGNYAGDMTIAEPFELYGAVAGTVTVVAGGKFYHRGAIYGDLIVEDGGRCHVFGNVQKNLIVKEGAKVILSGVVGGNAVNEGGRLYIDAIGKVTGKVRTRSGKTEIAGKIETAEE